MSSDTASVQDALAMPEEGDALIGQLLQLRLQLE